MSRLSALHDISPSIGTCGGESHKASRCRHLDALEPQERVRGDGVIIDAKDLLVQARYDVPDLLKMVDPPIGTVRTTATDHTPGDDLHILEASVAV